MSKPSSHPKRAYKPQSRLESWIGAKRPLSALKTLRFGFFMLLAYDLWTIALSHAPRYGVASFNATHLTWLDQVAPIPTPESIGALYLASGALAISVAVGLAGRVGVTLCALLYSASYFWSQADSYQHHYLLCLFLILFTLTPWLPEHARPTTTRLPVGDSSGAAVRGVGLSALMWQLSLIYAWTALAKCDAIWLSGDTLNAIISDPSQRDMIRDLGALVGYGQADTYRVLAWGVMLGEWFAALAILIAPLRPLAFLVVPWFHISVELVGFDIELFSYYMLLLNLTLLSPRWIWLIVDKPLKWIGVRGAQDQGESTARGISLQTWALALGCAGAVWLMVSSVQLEGAELGGLIGGVSVLVAVVSARPKLIQPDWATKAHRALPQTLSVILSVALFGLGLNIGVAEVSSERFRFDYYRLWGGDLKRRGELERAYQTYQIANQAQAPNLPARFVQLGDLATRLNKPGALEAYREGVRRRALAFESAKRTWSEHDHVRHLVASLSLDTSAQSASDQARSGLDQEIKLEVKLGLFDEVTLRSLHREVSRSARSATQALKKLLRATSRDERASRRAELIEISRGALEVSAQWSTILYRARAQALSDHVEAFEARVIEITSVDELNQLITPLREAHRVAESSLRDALKPSRQLSRSGDVFGETLAQHLESRERELSEMWGALSMSFDALREQIKFNDAR